MKYSPALIALLALACGSPGPSATMTASLGGSDGSGGAAGPGAGGGAGGGGGSGALSGRGGAPAEVPNPLGRLRCRAPAGVSGSPQTIEEAVALLNALPKPTSVACFVESLDRPLAVSSTYSPFSAQPALSSKSPRMFLKLGPLWISIVIDGESSDLVEFGYLIGDTLRSIKGELALPLEAPVAPGAPYERALYSGGGGTMCRFCHYDEQAEAVPGIDNVFSSVAFRPRPNTLVSTESLRLEALLCNWQLEPHRCEMLSAVFDGGQVLDSPFPDAMLTF